MFLSNYLLPLFTRTLPWSSVLRVFDVFFFEGSSFLLRVVLSILDLIRDQLISEKTRDQADLVDILVHIPKESLKPEVLLSTAFTIKINKKLLKKLKKQAEVSWKQGPTDNNGKKKDKNGKRT
jgi:TBC1 domain family member 10